MNKELTKPYPNKCYLPFVLYPPGMHKNMEGSDFVTNHVNMEQDGVDFTLYIGIPFCRKRCKSCPYFIKLLPENDKRNREDEFVDALLKDMKKWSRFKKFGEGNLKSIFIGGGTGSILKTENIKRIVDAVFDNFQVDKEYEFTLEGNARDFDDEKINYVAGSHINRLSLGVQSFHPEILEIVGSPHAAEDSIRVIRDFQEKGLTNIQMDLMYNMPGHTLSIWKSDLRKLNELGVKHFTIYLYRIHNETPQSQLINRGKVQKPENPENSMVKAMYREAKEMAENMGYKMYMMDHFCKPGYENKYNHSNWKIDNDTLAIGPGSYSYFDGYRLGTEADVEKYIEYVNRDEFLISSVTEYMPARVQRERHVVFSLVYFKIEYKFYYNKFGTQFLDDFAEEVERLERKGLVELNDDCMQLTELGLIWHANVILEFFNSAFWGDTDSLNEKNWSLNGVMVEVGARERSYWLGDKNDTSPLLNINSKKELDYVS
ncbi:coproporphyrinogen-III oxidase family protein [Mixta theicola]|uniref:coproporphyrinogen-III oxidase family protein n=1 Tax=Mixta theicola TaxID=1458355 RepID=UPI0010570A91|nr:coproporphyrinogen-III oxidase family protein [Mixta theicola]